MNYCIRVVQELVVVFLRDKLLAIVEGSSDIHLKAQNVSKSIK